MFVYRLGSLSMFVYIYILLVTNQHHLCTDIRTSSSQQTAVDVSVLVNTHIHSIHSIPVKSVRIYEKRPQEIIMHDDDDGDA